MIYESFTDLILSKLKQILQDGILNLNVKKCYVNILDWYDHILNIQIVLESAENLFHLKIMILFCLRLQFESCQSNSNRLKKNQKFVLKVQKGSIAIDGLIKTAYENCGLYRQIHEKEFFYFYFEFCKIQNTKKQCVHIFFGTHIIIPQILAKQNIII
ncbi:hypothetical protein BpHYR1_052785 [Brachionus plicatilis]|uniref:Uncharacterized protein n=1 Tax=Brachionus plicatilis TaxID=10195 RepID=A0A3M7T111_BRAPC|nr:hypothetical protein BpHYR1_052785 [Brachionus plicatilis]